MSAAADNRADTLLALALLKTNWELEQRSYIDNFNILTAECLKRSSDDVVSALAVHKALKSSFGLNLPLNTVELLLKRAAKQGWVTLAHGVYTISREKLRAVDFADTFSAVLEAQAKLLSDLCRFAGDRFKLTWTEEDAEQAITRYLSEEVVTFLRAAATRSLVPVPRKQSRSYKYVLASYVNHLVASDSPLFEQLKTVAEGNMLVTGIFLAGGTGSTAPRFTRTQLFFDTKFLLAALGHAGASLKAPNVEVLTLSRGAGAKLCCFTHTLDEVRAVLNGCSRSLSAGSSYPGYGPVYDHFLSVGASSSDVMLAASTLERDLDRLSIEVLKTPERRYEYAIDEILLEQAIRAKVYYSNENALIRDIASVAAVVKLRGDSKPRYIETANAVFVTPNRPLVEAIRDFLQADQSDDQVSIAITDGDLTNLLWLKRPLVAPELPRRRLIAMCYAALQPTDEFRRRYLVEIDKLQQRGSFSERDVYMLRHSIEARRIAMDITVGDETAFTMGTVPEVLASLQRQIRQEEAGRASEEKARADAADARAQELLGQLDSDKQLALEREARREARRDERIGRVAHIIAWLTAICFAAVLAVAIYLGIPEVPAPWFIPRWMRIAGAATAAVLTLVAALAPITIFETIRVRFERRVSAVLKRIGTWFAGD